MLLFKFFIAKLFGITPEFLIHFDHPKNQSVYELIKPLPFASKNYRPHQLFSNFGNSSNDFNHYPLHDKKMTTIESIVYCKDKIATSIIENNPEYFKKIK